MEKEKISLEKFRNFDFSKVVYLEWLNYTTIGDNNSIVIHYIKNNILKIIATESFINDELYSDAMSIINFGQVDLICVYGGCIYIGKKYFNDLIIDKDCLILYGNNQNKIICPVGEVLNKIKSYIIQTKEDIIKIKNIIKGKNYITIKEIQNEFKVGFVRIINCVEILIGENIMERTDEKLKIVNCE